MTRIQIATVGSDGKVGGPGGTPVSAVADATPSAKGVVQLGGDLAGSAAAPIVPALASKAGLDLNGVVQVSALPTIAQTRGLLLANREASAPLAANQSAQSNPYDTQDPTTVGIDGVGIFNAVIVADQAATLTVQSSPDGVTWTTEATVATAAVGSKQVARFSGIPSQRYVQAVETNGATPQTSNLFITTLSMLEAA